MNVNPAKCLTMVSLVGLFGMTSIAAANDKHSIDAKLDGYQVVSSQSTNGEGRFRAKIHHKDQMIEYQLSYKDLEGDILQSHIHFGRPGTNGGIVVFLCTNLPNKPPNTNPPPCPGPRDGKVTGIIQPEDVVYLPFPSQFPFDLTPGTTSQQLLEPGEFDELVKAIEAGAAYVVVHTKAQPTGELRGNIPANEHHHRD